MRLAAPENFAEFRTGARTWTSFPLRGDVQQIMASDTGREFMEKGGLNPLKSIRAVRKMIGPVVMDMAEDAYTACLDADAIDLSGGF